MAFLDRYTPWMLGILRIVAALVFMEHGTQKFFHFPAQQRFGGPGPRAAAGAAQSAVDTASSALHTAADAATSAVQQMADAASSALATVASTANRSERSGVIRTAADRVSARLQRSGIGTYEPSRRSATLSARSLSPSCAGQVALP